MTNPNTPWCNGNTAPFGGVILGSNPSGVANLSNGYLPMKTGNLLNTQRAAQKRTKSPPICQVFVKCLGYRLSADVALGSIAPACSGLEEKGILKIPLAYRQLCYRRDFSRTHSLTPEKASETMSELVRGYQNIEYAP